MTEKVRIFISYKTGIENNLTYLAEQVEKYLVEAGFEVWRDNQLEGGNYWNKQLISRIQEQDILLLLLSNKIMESDWVRREVDIARGAQVTILPVEITGGFDRDEVLEHFGIASMQTVKYTERTKGQKEALKKEILRIKFQARNTKRYWLDQRDGERNDNTKSPTTVFIIHNGEEEKDVVDSIMGYVTDLTDLLETQKENDTSRYSVSGNSKDDIVDTKKKKSLGEILDSDVVLVLLTSQSIDSLLVKRQIDFAKGASIEVIPVLKGSFDATDALKKKLNLDIDSAIKLFEGKEGETEKLLKNLTSAAKTTIKNHKDWYQKIPKSAEISQVDKTKHEPAEAHYKAYDLPDSLCRVYLAAGNMFDMHGIDVIVNSENNFMQMARFFEHTTISHHLRKRGAYFDDLGYLLEDTVQNELTSTAFKLFTRLPVPNSTIIATSSGHASSELVKKNGVRYIFHAATILVIDKGIMPVHVSATKISVWKALEMFSRVNETRGVVSPEDTDQRAKQEKSASKYKPIKSIIFPLFGTGHGQRSVDEAIVPIAEGFFEFLKSTISNEQHGPKEIYLSVYSEEDIKLADDVLSRYFNKINPSSTS